MSNAMETTYYGNFALSLKAAFNKIGNAVHTIKSAAR
jgi:hypothetical protein